MGRNLLGYVGFSLIALGTLGLSAFTTSKQVNSIDLAGSSIRLNLAGGAGVCSATHIGSGHFVTAAHCTEHGDIELMTDRGEKAKAEVLWGNKPYDLSLLRGDIKPRSAAIDCHLIKSGTLVTAAGNPLGMSFIRTPGVVVSGLQTDPIPVGSDMMWPERIVADISVAPGSSGGGLFNDLGRLVGVVVGMANTFRYAFVVPSSTVCGFLGR